MHNILELIDSTIDLGRLWLYSTWYRHSCWLAVGVVVLLMMHVRINKRQAMSSWLPAYFSIINCPAIVICIDLKININKILDAENTSTILSVYCELTTHTEWHKSGYVELKLKIKDVYSVNIFSWSMKIYVILDTSTCPACKYCLTCEVSKYWKVIDTLPFSLLFILETIFEWVYSNYLERHVTSHIRNRSSLTLSYFIKQSPNIYFNLNICSQI